MHPSNYPPAAPGEPLPEALSKLDPQLIENVCNDVMDSGGQLGERIRSSIALLGCHLRARGGWLAGPLLLPPCTARLLPLACLRLLIPCPRLPTLLIPHLQTGATLQGRSQPSG